MLVGEPALVLRDDGGAVAVGADPERIAPFLAAPDIDGARRHACVMLVENPAHRDRLLIRCGGLAMGCGSGPAVTHRQRCGNGLPVDRRAAASRQVTTRGGQEAAIVRQGWRWRHIGVVGIAVGRDGRRA